MAKGKELQLKYTDNRPQEDRNILPQGFFIILNPTNNTDDVAVKELRSVDPSRLSDPIMVQVRGAKGNGDFRTEAVVGLFLEDGELVPFASRDSAQEIAGKINNLSEIIRRRQ
ncbi:hypothetical protein KKD37_04665 [Patescibacteria group bacterium]|nr:hypothetical protein [Patescibacteria group bacterium]